MTDLYQLTMADAYLRAGVNDVATFSLFIRRLPPTRRYLVSSGLEEALQFLTAFRFTKADIAYLESLQRFSDELLDLLSVMRFSGAVRAILEGRVVFAGEPLIEVSAPLIEAQLVETALINIMHVHTLLTSKAARCVDAAAGRDVVDFGLRRAHGFDAGLAAARSAYIAGCVATSNVAAGERYNIPLQGTMAHSFVMSFPDELSAFRAYASAFPDTTTLLIDTYDTLNGARHAATVAAELAATGHKLRAVRLDSGDLAVLSRQVRQILDERGFPDVRVIASGGLDEHQIHDLVAGGAPIDGFGVGTRMDASEDAPTLEAAYKLVEYGRRPVMKRSSGKVSLPGCKQYWRRVDSQGKYAGDVLGVHGEYLPMTEALMLPVMEAGRRLFPREGVESIRARCLDERDRLPEAIRRLDGDGEYPVGITPKLAALQETASTG